MSSGEPNSGNSHPHPVKDVVNVCCQALAGTRSGDVRSVRPEPSPARRQVKSPVAQAQPMATARGPVS